MTSFKLANELFSQKKYEQALNAYKKLELDNSSLSETIDFNIEICKKRLLAQNASVGKKISAQNLSFEGGKDFYIEKVKEYKKQKEKRKASVVVFTAITGGYDGLINPDIIVDDWDYVLFTDGMVDDETVFESRSIPFSDLDPVRIARYVKINAHKLLSEYDYCIWIDGNVYLKSDFYHQVNKLINSNSSIAFRKHPDRQSPYQEINKCQELLKDDFSLMSKQLDKYLENNYEPLSPLFETNVIFRSLKNETVTKFNELWWNELSSGSRRDQLSVNYALDKTGLNYNLFDTSIDIRDPNNSVFYIFSHNGVKSKKDSSKPFAHISEIKFLEKKRKKTFVYEEDVCEKYPIPFVYKNLLLKGRDLGFYDESISLLIKTIECEKNNYKKAVGYFILGFLLSYKKNRNKNEVIDNLKNCLSISSNEALNRDAQFLLSEFGSSKEKGKFFNLGVDGLVQSINSEANVFYKINHLNDIFRNFGLSDVRWVGNEKNSVFDSIYPAVPLNRFKFVESKHKVSIIMSCYNVESSIFTSLSSLLNQSWKNIEIICVDDASTDNTISIINYFKKFDSRVKLYQRETNSGTYKNRNFALSVLSGDIITVADADDWHHPQKIQYQVEYLLNSNECVANVASWIRVTNNLHCNRRNGLSYKHLNISSLMFKKNEVLDLIGAWDEVRFAADGEFYKRLKNLFPGAVAELPAITSLGRFEEGSLTNNATSGYFGFPFGVRKEYLESYEFFHKTASSNQLCYKREQRVYPAPSSMLLKSAKKIDVDKVFVSDFRDEVNAHKAIDFIYCCERKNITWGVCHLPSFEGDARKKIHESLRYELSKRMKCCLVFGEDVCAKEVILFGEHLPITSYEYLPSLSFKDFTVVSKGSVSKKLKDFVFLKYNASFNVKYFPDAEKVNSDDDGGELYYDSLQVLDVSEINSFVYKGSSKISIVMPCIDLELGKKTAEILIRRADIDCTVVIAMDTERQGFIKTLNSVASKIDSRYICFVAQDAYPGRSWLKIAYSNIYNHKKGLLAFNDGKWHGRIASFGLVNKSWIESFYGNSILHESYKAHKADNEITLIAKLDDSFIYCPDSVLLEIDYGKDSGGSNLDDDAIFVDRFKSGFDGKFPYDQVVSYSKEYKVKV